MTRCPPQYSIWLVDEGGHPPPGDGGIRGRTQGQMGFWRGVAKNPSRIFLHQRMGYLLPPRSDGPEVGLRRPSEEFFDRLGPEDPAGIRRRGMVCQPTVQGLWVRQFGGGLHPQHMTGERDLPIGKRERGEGSGCPGLWF